MYNNFRHTGTASTHFVISQKNNNIYMITKSAQCQEGQPLNLGDMST